MNDNRDIDEEKDASDASDASDAAAAAASRLGNVEGVSVVGAEKPITMAWLVGELEESLEQYKTARTQLSALRTYILSLKDDLADRGLKFELEGIYDEVEAAGAEPIPMERVEPIVPPAGTTFGPGDEPDGGQTADEMAAAVERSGAPRDSRTAARVVEEAHEGIVEDQATFASVLAAGYGGALERGMEEAGRKAVANVRGPGMF